MLPHACRSHGCLGHIGPALTCKIVPVAPVLVRVVRQACFPSRIAVRHPWPQRLQSIPASAILHRPSSSCVQNRGPGSEFLLPLLESRYPVPHSSPDFPVEEFQATCERKFMNMGMLPCQVASEYYHLRIVNRTGVASRAGYGLQVDIVDCYRRTLTHQNQTHSLAGGRKIFHLQPEWCRGSTGSRI